MDLAEFREGFLSTVAARAASDQTFRHTSFVEYASEQLTEAGELSDVEIAYFRGVGTRNRSSAMDAFAFDNADSSLRVVVADPTFAEVASTFTLSDVKSLMSRASTFVEDAVSGRGLAAIEPSLAAWGLANDINRRQGDIARVRVYLVTDQVLSAHMPDWPEAAIAGIPVEAHLWDISRFQRMAESASGRDELIIDFESRIDGGLRCLAISSGDGDYDAYLLAVPGALLADIYDEYGSRLLEGNVRSFLSMRPAVNKGIKNTALNLPHMFFAYNNGIAATASEIRIADREGGARLLMAKDLQIVNGGQTTASLATARRTEKASLAGVFVQMKLSVVDAERSAEMIPNIAKYANSQNRVSEADFFSNHEFHRRLEEISRRIWAPAKPGSQHETHWFYERARGQYLNETAALTPAIKRRFLDANPRDQMITKTDLAKAEMAWRGQPQTASLGAQKNFLKFAELISTEWATDDGQFNEGYFRAAVARTVLFRATEKMVSKQPWYQGGYRANVVYYSLARLVLLASEAARGKAVDLEAIWRAQAPPDPVDRQMQLVTKAMHDVITTPPAHVQNVTEWAKRDLCWERARDVHIDLLPAFYSSLVDQSVVRAANVAEKRQQKVDSGIGAQVLVASLGADYWRRLQDWAQGRGLLLADEGTLLRLATGARGFPDDRQSSRLIALKQRMEGEGFPVHPAPS
jgi:AIPR protein/Abortive infection phage resistance protein N-terminal domain